MNYRKIMARSSLGNLFFGVIERLFVYRYLNVWKTIYINFRSLPMSQAICFPIVVWGSVKIISLMGNIEIKAPIKTGMIKLGVQKPIDFVSSLPSRFNNSGKLIFMGTAEIYNGYSFYILPNAIVEIGNDCCFSNNIVFYAIDDIIIGEGTRFAFGSKMMSSDQHYSIDTETMEVSNNRRRIQIGAFNWITSDVKIMKGTVTPDWTIVTANSILNKDYTKTINPNSVLGGIPAKLIKENQRRIFSLDSEKKITKFFLEDLSESKFKMGDDIDLDLFTKR